MPGWFVFLLYHLQQPMPSPAGTDVAFSKSNSKFLMSPDLQNFRIQRTHRAIKYQLQFHSLYKTPATPLVACPAAVNSFLLVGRILTLFKCPAFSMKSRTLGYTNPNPSHTCPTVYYHICMGRLILKQPTCNHQGEPIVTLMMVLSVKVHSEKRNWYELYRITNLLWGFNYPQF